MPIPAPPVRSPPRIRCSFYILTRSPHRPSPPIGTAKARQDGQAVSRRRHGHDTPGHRMDSPEASQMLPSGLDRFRNGICKTSNLPRIDGGCTGDQPQRPLEKIPEVTAPPVSVERTCVLLPKRKMDHLGWTDVGTPERLVNWLDSRRSPSWSTETRPTAPHPSATCAR